jgi:zinc/manganese transport system substrate-binding protein
MKRPLLAGLLAAATALAAALQPAEALGARLNVVATVPALAAIAKEVGGEAVAVTALASPNQDPHFVDARPNLILPLNHADLLVVNGVDLETGWLPTLQTGARNGNIQMGSSGYLDASMLVPLKQVPMQKIDRSMGDLHPGGNPHYLIDARNGARVAAGMAQRFGQLLPRRAGEFRQRAAAFTKQANTFADQQTKRFAALPAAQRQTVSYHQSLVYLNDWLGLKQIGMIEPKPGVPPTPSHVAALLGLMREQKADAILQESYYPSRFGQLLADKTGAAFVLLPGGPNVDQGETYLHFLGTVTDKVHAALSHRQ